MSQESRHGLVPFRSLLFFLAFFPVLSCFCEGSEQYVGIQFHFKKHPEERSRYVTWRLTSVKTELETEEMIRWHARILAAERSGSDKVPERVQKLLAKAAKETEQFFSKLLAHTNKNDPIYFYKYRRNDKDITERGYLIVEEDGNIRKFVRGTARRLSGSQPNPADDAEQSQRSGTGAESGSSISAAPGVTRIFRE